MSTILVIAPMQNQFIRKLVISMNSIWMEHSIYVDWFEFDDSPTGLCLSRYDGFLLGGDSDDYESNSNLHRWIIENEEQLMSKSFGMFTRANSSCVFTCGGPIDYIHLSNIKIFGVEFDLSAVFCVDERIDDSIHLKNLESNALKFAKSFQLILNRNNEDIS